MMKLETNESIEIEVNENCGMVTIEVNGSDYAQFQDAELNELNLDYLSTWIEETYYTNDYKCSAYIPCDLHKEEFTRYTDSEMKPACKYNLLETHESVLYIMITNDKKYLIAGSVCNIGMLQHFQEPYDDSFSLDENLQEFIEIIQEKEGSVE